MYLLCHRFDGSWRWLSGVHSAYSVAVGQNHEIQAFSPGSFTSGTQNVINLGGTSDKPGGTAFVEEGFKYTW